MKVYRGELHGRLLECREGDFGGESVLVDGRVVSNKWWAGWVSGSGGVVSHFFAVKDEEGKDRHVEVRWRPKAKTLGLTSTVQVNVDGKERAMLTATPVKSALECCMHCGYSLKGLEVENGEVKCPECGRHTGAVAAGLG